MSKKRINALRAMLNDPQPEVRQAAAASLDALEAIADLDRLLEKLRTGETGERIAAAFSLERVNADRVYPALMSALESEEPGLRLVAVKVLGSKKHPKTLAALLAMLDDPELGIQAQTARVLGGFADQRLLEHLVPLLVRDEQVALAALDAIGQLRFPEGEVALFTALRDQRSPVRAKAAELLGTLDI